VMPTSVKTNGLNYTRRCVFPVARLPQREYSQVLVAMHVMWNKCKLVHGDLSEYNILYCPAPPSPAPPSPAPTSTHSHATVPPLPSSYHRGHVVIIDVSQSVEHEHPNALSFLRRDATNVNVFTTPPLQSSQPLLTFTPISTNSPPSSRLFSAATAFAHCLCAAFSSSFRISEEQRWMLMPCK
jgi:hypothetical protein